jgi:hypothetical protein
MIATIIIKLHVRQLLGSELVNVSKQRNCKQMYNNRGFLWGLRRVLIRGEHSDAVQFRAVTSRKQFIAENP